MGGNDEWGQTWSHTSLGKCERHRTLVGIHWLTINAKKGFFIPSGESQKRCLGVRWEVERDGGSFTLLSLVFVCHARDILKVFTTFLDQPDPDTPCYSPTATAEPPKSTSQNGVQGRNVGLEREKNIDTNNRWCQPWSYISIRKCEMHQTLVCIHWLTINARKGDFQAR